MIFEKPKVVKAMGLIYIMYLFEIQANTLLLSALAKRWFFETCSFHFPTSDMSITLEDVYMILRISIHDELVLYDKEGDKDALR